MLSPVLDDVFNKIADVAALSCFIGLVAFIALYMSFYQWRKRRAGKSVLLLAWAFVVISAISTAALWIGPDFWLRPLWRMMGWLFGLFAVGYLVYALLYNWKDRHPLMIEPRSGATSDPSDTI